ncbi:MULTISPECIES: hypothetical protein [unclassified Microbacterium]|uniref:hypothetical protein n=1 Tax=unclassified Microbacterium TaxID=2609290 RepID=UPI00044B49AA|nr:hypothetical protein [Microbacterium sp. MRS-1]EXJ51484.1 hypothetical protein AS96_09235 [Microbacterium sp. MRS-1]
MSWFSNDDKKHDEKKKDTMSQKFFNACLLILGGVIVLALAIQLLSQIWVWVVIGLAAFAAGWIAFRIWMARRNRW